MADSPTRIRFQDEGDTREASKLIDDPKLNPPLRLWIEAEQGGLIRIGAIAVSSRSETAEEVRRSQGHSFWATKEDVRWFIEQLPAALAFAESPREAPEPEPEDFHDVIGEGSTR